MRYFNDSGTIRSYPSIPKLIIFICFGILLSFSSTHANEPAVILDMGFESDYIYSLDLTVMRSDDGDVKIVKIGFFSPFRRYSWFRVGDVIETVNGRRTTVYALSNLNQNETPWIKYRRGLVVSELQIGLEKVIYSQSYYLDAQR